MGRSPGEGNSNPVFLLGESLLGYSPWAHNESDMAEQLTLIHNRYLIYFFISYDSSLNCKVHEGTPPIPQALCLPPSESAGSPGGQSPMGLNCPSQEGRGPRGRGTASALSPETTTGPRAQLCRPRHRTCSHTLLESSWSPIDPWDPAGVSRSSQTLASQGLLP